MGERREWKITSAVSSNSFIFPFAGKGIKNERERGGMGTSRTLRAAAAVLPESFPWMVKWIAPCPQPSSLLLLHGRCSQRGGNIQESLLGSRAWQCHRDVWKGGSRCRTGVILGASGGVTLGSLPFAPDPSGMCHHWDHSQLCEWFPPRSMLCPPVRAPQGKINT